MVTKTRRKTPARSANTGKRNPKSGPAANSGAREIAINTVSIGAAAGVLAAGIFGLFRLARNGTFDTVLGRGDAGHVPTDLLGDEHPDGSERAPVDFRPDPTAPIPANERDAFRPALAGASAPTLVKGQAPELERRDAAPS